MKKNIFVIILSIAFIINFYTASQAPFNIKTWPAEKMDRFYPFLTIRLINSIIFLITGIGVYKLKKWAFNILTLVIMWNGIGFIFPFYINRILLFPGMMQLSFMPMYVGNLIRLVGSILIVILINRRVFKTQFK